MAKKTAKKTARKSAKKTVKKAKAAKKTAGKTTRKAAKKVVKRAAKKVVKRVVKKVVGKAAKKAAVKTDGKSAVKTARVPKAKRLKSPLSRRDTEHFRQMLREKRRQLLGDMSGMEAEALSTNRQEGSGDLSTMPVHMADVGTDNYEQEFTLGLLESEQQLLGEINEAFARLDEGFYGLCMGTGEAIGKARLRAKPWAKYCIAYARQIEQGLIAQPADDYGVSAAEDEDEGGD